MLFVHIVKENKTLWYGWELRCPVWEKIALNTNMGKVRTPINFFFNLLISERERFVVPLIYTFSSWFLYVPWPGIEPVVLVYWDDALTNWVTGWTRAKDTQFWWWKSWNGKQYELQRERQMCRRHRPQTRPTTHATTLTMSVTRLQAIL